MRRMKLSDIKISDAFANSIPRVEKLNDCRNNWNLWNRQDRYIVINPDNVLIDGYIQYLVLKENNVEEVEVKISNRRKKRWYRKNVEDWNVTHYKNDVDLDDWLEEYAANNNTYFIDQRKNYSHMVSDFKQYQKRIAVA